MENKTRQYVASKTLNVNAFKRDKNSPAPHSPHYSRVFRAVCFIYLCYQAGPLINNIYGSEKCNDKDLNLALKQQKYYR